MNVEGSGFKALLKKHAVLYLFLLICSIALISGGASLIYFNFFYTSEVNDLSYSYGGMKLTKPVAISNSEKDKSIKITEYNNEEYKHPGLIQNNITVIPTTIPSLNNLPSSVDLSSQNRSGAIGPDNQKSGTSFNFGIPPIGAQGSVPSCVSWAMGYYLMGWYANRDGYYPSGGFSAGYLYSQIVAKNHQNIGSNPDENWNLMISSGIDTNSDFTQGNYSPYSPPTEKEKNNAFQYRAMSGKYLFNVNYNSVPTLHGIQENIIKEQLAKNGPLTIGINLDNNFMNLNSKSWHLDKSSNSANAKYGSNNQHEIFVYGYDTYGIYVANSFGTGWGNKGFAILSWDFVKTNTFEAESLTPATYTPPVNNVPKHRISGALLNAKNDQCITDPHSTDSQIPGYSPSTFSVTYKGTTKDGKSITGGGVMSSEQGYTIDSIPEGDYFITLNLPPGYRTISCKKNPSSLKVVKDDPSIGFYVVKSTYISGYVLVADSKGQCSTNKDNGRYTGSQYRDIKVSYTGVLADNGGNVSGSVNLERDPQGNTYFNIPQTFDGKYTLNFTAPSGYRLASSADCNGRTNPYTFNMSTQTPNGGAGFWIVKSGENITPTPTPILDKHSLTGFILSADSNGSCTTVANNGAAGKLLANEKDIKIKYEKVNSNESGIVTPSRDSSGNVKYSVSNLSSGEYRITLTPPSGYTVTTSCRPNGSVFSVEGSDNGSAGFWLIPPVDKTYTLSGYILTVGDDYACSTSGVSQTGTVKGRYYGLVEGIKIVYSGPKSGEVISSRDHYGNMGYSVSSLPIGDYKVTIVPPPGFSVASCRQSPYTFKLNNSDNGSGGFWFVPEKTYNLGGYILKSDSANNCSVGPNSSDGKNSQYEYKGTSPSITVVSSINGYTFSKSATFSTDHYGNYGYNISGLPSGEYKVNIIPPTGISVANCRPSGIMFSIHNSSNPSAGFWLY